MVILSPCPSPSADSGLCLGPLIFQRTSSFKSICSGFVYNSNIGGCFSSRLRCGCIEKKKEKKKKELTHTFMRVWSPELSHLQAGRVGGSEGGVGGNWARPCVRVGWAHVAAEEARGTWEGITCRGGERNTAFQIVSHDNELLVLFAVHRSHSYKDKTSMITQRRVRLEGCGFFCISAWPQPQTRSCRKHQPLNFPSKMTAYWEARRPQAEIGFCL